MGVLAVRGRDRLRPQAGRPGGQLPGAVVAAAAAAARRRSGLDFVPRRWLSRGNPSLSRASPRTAGGRTGTGSAHAWSRVGVICFYVVYVSYRNLKSFLPSSVRTRRRPASTTASSTCSTRRCSSATTPAVLHGSSARGSPPRWPCPSSTCGSLPAGAAGGHGLAGVVAQHLLRLLVRDLAVPASPGRSARCVLPALDATPRPASSTPRLYGTGLPTPAPLSPDGRARRTAGTSCSGRAPPTRSSRSPGFASLHVAITLLVALMVQYTTRMRWLKIVFWVNFGLTVVATLCFGWHYIADDVAG